MLSEMKRACVIVPVYNLQISEFEQISLTQSINILGNHDIFIVSPLRFRNENFDHLTKGICKIKFFDDSYFSDIPGYNRLMKNPVFYSAFTDYDFMLVLQLDAFVFRDELVYWMGQDYDYIGAPLFEGHETAGKNAPIVGQGNGGFSLRRIKTFLKVLNSVKRLQYRPIFLDEPSFLRKMYRYFKHRLIYNYSCYPFQPFINEDIFWFKLVPNAFPSFKVPDPLESMRFSFEVNPDVLFEMNNKQLPFGCHAWWKYNLEFWKPHIRKFGYKI